MGIGSVISGLGNAIREAFEPPKADLPTTESQSAYARSYLNTYEQLPHDQQRTAMLGALDATGKSSTVAMDLYDQIPHDQQEKLLGMVLAGKNINV